MKKIVSLLLIFALAFSVFSAAAFAAPAGEDYTPSDNAKAKVSDGLAQFIEERDPERWVGVYMWFSYPAVTYDKTRSDFESVQDYVAYQRQTNSAYHTAKNRECFDMIAESFEIAENYLSILTPMAMVTIKVKDVYPIAEFDFVAEIDYDSENDDLQPGDKGYPAAQNSRFFDRFLEYYQISAGVVARYQEEYYHYTDPDDESTLDWVIVRAYENMCSPAEFHQIIEGRVVEASNWYYPFRYGYGLYDVKEDKFMDLYNIFDQYDGLSEVFAAMPLKYPAYEFGENDFYRYLQNNTPGFSHVNYRVLAFHDQNAENKQDNYFGCDGYDIDWALVTATADCDDTVPMVERPFSWKFGDKLITAKTAPAPFECPVALFDNTRENYGFYRLDDIDVSDYEGLADALNKQDWESLGFEVSSGYRHKDAFIKSYNDYFTYQGWNELSVYDELYWHMAENGENDWSLIYYESGLAPPWMVKSGGFIGDRAVFSIAEGSVFASSYGVYDVKNDRFLSLPKAAEEGFDGLADVVNQLKLGVEIGDADQDGLLSVLDATRIQKILAGIATYEQLWDDAFNQEPLDGNATLYVSDIDRDGVRSILDATRIQKFLAGIVDKNGNMINS